MTRNRRSSRLHRQTVASLAAGFLLVALGLRPAAVLAEVAPAAPAAPTAAAPTAAGAPHGGGGGEKALAAEGSTVTTATFRFELPATWRREQPSSGMRLAQAVVPGEAGPGELAVFHFGAGQGGGVESNFERWLGQVEQARGGKPGARRARRRRLQGLLDRRPRHPPAVDHGQRSVDAAARLPAPGRGRRRRGRSLVLQADRSRVDARQRARSVLRSAARRRPALASAPEPAPSGKLIDPPSRIYRGATQRES